MYSFETSAGAEVGADYMQNMLSNGDSYEDLTALITTYGNNAFNGSYGCTINIGNGLTFGDNAFITANNSTIEVGNFTASTSLTFGVGTANSTWRFKGTIGANTSLNSIFSGDIIGQTIETIVANQTSNAGGVEGDLADLIASGATVSFNL